MHVFGIDASGTVDYLKSNPLVGLSAAAVGGYLLRSASSWANSLRVLVMGQLGSELEMHQAHPYCIGRLSRLLDGSRLTAFSRNFTLDTSGEKIVTGYGPGFAIWRGLPISYSRSFEVAPSGVVDHLAMTFWTRDPRRVQAFVDEAMSDADEAKTEIVVYDYAASEWNRVASRRLRSMRSVFANPGVREDLLARIAWFRDNEQWYAQRGLGYKLVIFMHGMPGCGKTSLIQAVATEMGRDIYSLGSIWNVDQVAGRVGDRGILVIEDIDTLASLTRERISKRDDDSDEDALRREKLNRYFGSGADPALHALLNVFDGMNTPHGLVAIITSNKIEELDPALLRPCRIDHLVEVTPLEWTATTEMFTAYFGSSDAIRDLERSWRAHTGAELQQAMMSCVSAEEAAVALRRLCEEKQR